MENLKYSSNRIPEISVVMSVYNTEKYLQESIESMLNQTFKNFELIIINDHSTDNSLKIIKDYSKKDDRIILINNKKNSGSAFSRNEGIKIARGKYIAIMDSDDISLPDRLDYQHNFLEEHKNLFLVGGSWINITESGEEISTVKHSFGINKINKKLPYKSMIHQPTIMFRNEEIISYRDKFRYAQDRDLFLRFLSGGKTMEIVPKVFIKYRINSGSVSIKKSFEQLFFRNKAIEFYFQRKKKGEDEYKTFNPQRELTLFDESKISKCNEKSSLIVLFKQNLGGPIFRNKLSLYWKKYGYLSWVFSIFYYLISYMPKNMVKLSIKTIDRYTT